MSGIICPRCGTENAGHARFCKNCGESFIKKDDPLHTDCTDSSNSWGEMSIYELQSGLFALIDEIGQRMAEINAAILENLSANFIQRKELYSINTDADKQKQTLKESIKSYMPQVTISTLNGKQEEMVEPVLDKLKRGYSELTGRYLAYKKHRGEKDDVLAFELLNNFSSIVDSASDLLPRPDVAINSYLESIEHMQDEIHSFKEYINRLCSELQEGN